MPDYPEVLAHFPRTISQDIVDFATDTVFLASRYIFTRRVKSTQHGSFQYGFCTHCRQEYLCGSGSVYLKHGEDWRCNKCNSLCIVKASGRGRKYLRDEGYFVYYEKSAINPNAIIAWGLHAVRDYSGDYYKTETKFRTVAMYLFEPGKSTMLEEQYWGRGWIKRKSVRSEYHNSMRNKRCFTSIESIVSAVHGTPFQYCTWEKYTEQAADLVQFFDLAAKYPCVEYLTKLGLRSIIEAKLIGSQTYGVVNWRGKTLDKVLRLSKAEIKDLRNAKFRIKPLTLHSYHFYKRLRMQLTMQEANMLQDLSDGYYLDEAKKLSGHASFTQISQYVLKQLRKEDVAKHYRDGSSILVAWRDYIKDCQELGMDLKQGHVLFPNNIYAAHQKTIEKVKIKQDNALNIMIAKRLKGLQKYAFEQAGLFLRPAQDSIELFKEGKALNHCVGRYSKTYAEGKTNLFVIRKKDEPDTPFYTMELIDDKIIQVKGKSNCQPTDEVKAFIEAFTAGRLAKKARKSKTKAKIAQPA